MANRESLIQAMHLPDETVRHIDEHGVVLADLDTMSRAIHDVYCGVTADHEHPNEKDRDQAGRLLDAVRTHGGAPYAGMPER
jgi:hypothetical protein